MQVNLSKMIAERGISTDLKIGPHGYMGLVLAFQQGETAYIVWIEGGNVIHLETHPLKGTMTRHTLPLIDAITNGIIVACQHTCAMAEDSDSEVVMGAVGREWAKAYAKAHTKAVSNLLFGSSVPTHLFELSVAENEQGIPFAWLTENL